MALGADRGTVTGMVVGEVLRRGAIGTLIGVPAAFAATGLIRSALYGIGPVDVKDSSIAALTLVASLLAAGYAPARRASRIEPLEALRHE
jgi:ABC-type antimicrobial peptide transport system permease subunit